jgi:hypothetical protein
MTITDSYNQRHADAQRPAGIADDEWAAVLRVRQRKAEEAAAAEHCTHVMADLKGTADGGFEDEDWDPVARRFLDRRPPLGRRRDRRIRLRPHARPGLQEQANPQLRLGMPSEGDDQSLFLDRKGG